MSQSIIQREDSQTTAPVKSKAFYQRKSAWAFVVALVFYTALSIFAFLHPYFGWDLRITNFVQRINLPGFEKLMILLTALGNGWTPYLLVICTSILLRLKKHKSAALICLVGVSASSAVNQLMKIIVNRPRPSSELIHVFFDVRHKSFPSGHTIFFVAFFGFLLFLTYVYRKRPLYRWGMFLLFGGMIALIGLSRIYLGAHWSSDVIGGYLTGSLWLSVMIRSYAYLKLREEHIKERKRALQNS
jgi:membrane-associated phospholipid phosphatase